MSVESKYCPKCNQPNNPSFKNCWKCKASLDDAGCDGKTKDSLGDHDGEKKKTDGKSQLLQKKIDFKFFAPQAKKVELGGCFNNWKANKNQLKKDAAGNWKTSLKLAPGRYEYRYLVDGVWQNAQEPVECVPNASGTWNCVVHVGEVENPEYQCNASLNKWNGENERFYGTDVFKHFSKKYPNKLGKSNLSDEEKRRIETLMALPDARPCPGDGTIEAWLLRISLWGKIKITHNNPDEDVRNASMNYDQFISYADDQARNEVYGKWNAEYPKINLVKWVRRFYSFYKNKDVTEEIIVEIDLRDDLKARLKEARK